MRDRVKMQKRGRVEMMVDVRVRIGMKILIRVWVGYNDRERCREKRKWSRRSERNGRRERIGMIRCGSRSGLVRKCGGAK